MVPASWMRSVAQISPRWGRDSDLVLLKCEVTWFAEQQSEEERRCCVTHTWDFWGCAAPPEVHPPHLQRQVYLLIPPVCFSPSNEGQHLMVPFVTRTFWEWKTNIFEQKRSDGISHLVILNWAHWCIIPQTAQLIPCTHTCMHVHIHTRAHTHSYGDSRIGQLLIPLLYSLLQSSNAENSTCFWPVLLLGTNCFWLVGCSLPPARVLSCSLRFTHLRLPARTSTAHP